MKKQFKLEGLECANCAAKIERAVAKLPGVLNATVNFMTTKMTIESENENIEEIINKAIDVVHKYESHIVVKRM